MKKNNRLHRLLFVDPLALVAACLISLLFVNAAHYYVSNTKRNLSTNKQTLVCSQTPDNLTPEDRPYLWSFKNLYPFQKEIKKNTPLAVTFDIHGDYRNRLKGYFYELSQPSARLPSIPIAYRRLII